MNLVDSSGWLAFLADTENAEKFAVPLRDTGTLLVPSIVVYEVSKVLLRERGEEATITAFAYMQQGIMVNLDSDIALKAAAVSRRSRLPMADSVILATAETFDAAIWTQDSHFKGIPKVKYFEA